MEEEDKRYIYTAYDDEIPPHPWDRITAIMLPNIPRFFSSLFFVGKTNSGKSVVATLLTERCAKILGLKNCTIWIYDNDYRFLEKYLAKHLSEKEVIKAHRELKKVILTCKTPYLLIQISDAGRFFSQRGVKKKERHDVDKLINFIKKIRHKNPKLQGIVLIIAAQTFGMVSLEMRREIGLPILKSCNLWILQDVLNFYSLSPDQIKLFKKFNKKVMEGNQKHLGMILFDDNPVEFSFGLPDILIDFDAEPRVRSEEELLEELDEEEEEQTLITNIQLADWIAIRIKKQTPHDRAKERGISDSGVVHNVRKVDLKLEELGVDLEELNVSLETGEVPA